jgi:hypothetical protein
MVSVLQVYNAVKDIANKDQKGFITPGVFNSFASIAQMNIYNEMFSELVDAKRLSRQNFELGRDKSVRKQREEDLSYFLAEMEITVAEGLADKPSDLSKIISLSVVGPPTVPVEIVYDSEKMDRIAGSNLSAPSASFPVALVSALDIEVFPSDTSKVKLRYYAKPTSIDKDGNISEGSPYYDYDVVTYNGNDLELPSSSCRDFMLPPHYLNEVVMEIAKLIGVRLRDPNVTQFAAQEEASE